MSAPINAVLTGQFTSAGTLLNLPIPSGYQDFEMINLTDIGSTASTTPVMKARGTSYMTAGSAYVSTKTNGAATVALENTVTANGFTFVADSGKTTPGAQLTGSAITSAAPAVLDTTTTTTVAAGSVVRVYNTTGLLQIAGWDFTVGTVTPSTSFTLAYLDTTLANLSGGASAANFRVIPFSPRYYPALRRITNIGSSGTNTIITMSVTHGYTVGQLVRIYVPSQFGMTQINGVQGTITAIGAADTSGFTNTITLNINSSGFTAFGWPTSATAAAGVNFPFVEPVGEAATVPYQNSLDGATRNISFTGVQIGTAVQTSGKLYQWFARTGVALS